MTDATITILVLIGGLAAGVWLGVLWGGARVRAEMAKSLGEAEARAQEAHTRLEEQKAGLAKAREELTQAFSALAGEALKSNNQAFLDLAKSTFATLQTEAKGDLAQREQAIQSLINPLSETLKRYETQIVGMDQAWRSDHAGLRERIEMLLQSEGRLQRETGNLVNALRVPHVRGRWGEVTLKRVAEFAGMVEHCDFIEQETVEGEAGRLRPDMIIQMPAGRQIVVDAKAPLAAYLEAVEAQEDTVRQERLRQHAAQVRTRLELLSEKAYWNQLPEATEFVVLFLPGEQFLGAALEYDRTLIEDGYKKGVFIATPTNLIALLRVVERGWRQEKLAESARAISALGKELFERIAVMVKYLKDMEAALGKMNTAYNQAVGSLESRVLPAARKFKDLGIASEKDIPQLEAIEQAPRPMPEVNDTT